MVLSHAFWERAFAADASVLGRRVRMNGIDFTVIGVLPESFPGLDLFVRPDFYVPLPMWPALVGADQPNPLEQRDRRALELKGRLASGFTMAQAGADVARIGAALAEEYPATNRGYEMRVRSASNAAGSSSSVTISVIIGATSMRFSASMATQVSKSSRV